MVGTPMKMLTGSALDCKQAHGSAVQDSQSCTAWHASEGLREG